MLYKNLEEKEFKYIYKIRFILDYLAALQMIAKGKFKNAKATHQAHMEFNKMKKTFNKARKENLDKQTTQNITSIFPKSILWQFFLKGHKTFSSLVWKINN